MGLKDMSRPVISGLQWGGHGGLFELLWFIIETTTERILAM